MALRRGGTLLSLLSGRPTGSVHFVQGGFDRCRGGHPWRRGGHMRRRGPWLRGHRLHSHLLPRLRNRWQLHKLCRSGRRTAAAARGGGLRSMGRRLAHTSHAAAAAGAGHLHAPRGMHAATPQARGDQIRVGAVHRARRLYCGLRCGLLCSLRCSLRCGLRCSLSRGLCCTLLLLLLLQHLLLQHLLLQHLLLLLRV